MTDEQFRADLRQRLGALIEPAKTAYLKSVIDKVTAEMQNFIDKRLPEEDAILFRRRVDPRINTNHINRFTDIGPSSYIEGAFTHYPTKGIEELIAAHNATLDWDRQDRKLTKFEKQTVAIDTVKIQRYANGEAAKAVDDLIKKLAKKLSFLKDKTFTLNLTGIVFNDGVGETKVGVKCDGYPDFEFKLKLVENQTGNGDPYEQATLTFSGPANSADGIRKLYITPKSDGQ